MAAMFNQPDRGGHLAAATAAAAALEAIRPITRELYEPKSPLQVQLDYTRARRDLNEIGIIVPSPATEL